MEPQPQTDISNLFNIGANYMFHLNNSQEITGTVLGVTIVDTDWVLAVKDSENGNTRLVKYHTISNWIPVPERTKLNAETKASD